MIFWIQFSLTKKLPVITKQADKKYSPLNLPHPLTINCKLVEHTLCKFSQYCRFANETPKKKFTSGAFLDDTKKCEFCQLVERNEKLWSSFGHQLNGVGFAHQRILLQLSHWPAYFMEPTRLSWPIFECWQVIYVM